MFNSFISDIFSESFFAAVIPLSFFTDGLQPVVSAMHSIINKALKINAVGFDGCIFILFVIILTILLFHILLFLSATSPGQHDQLAQKSFVLPRVFAHARDRTS